MTKLWKNKFTY